MDLSAQGKKQEAALRYLKTVLGKNIRLRREELGYSQEKLAFLAGMGAAHLGNIERGSDKNNPTLSTLLKISIGLHITLEDLLNGTCLPEKMEEPEEPIEKKEPEELKEQEEPKEPKEPQPRQLTEA